MIKSTPNVQSSDLLVSEVESFFRRVLRNRTEAHERVQALLSGKRTAAELLKEMSDDNQPTQPDKARASK